MIVGTINPYPYSTIPTAKVSIKDRPKIGLKRFKFKDKCNYAYIVEVEIYEHNAYAIKFFVKKHGGSPFRYNILTGHKDARRIIDTCIQIGVDLHKIDELISF